MVLGGKLSSHINKANYYQTDLMFTHIKIFQLNQVILKSCHNFLDFETSFISFASLPCNYAFQK